MSETLCSIREFHIVLPCGRAVTRTLGNGSSTFATVFADHAGGGHGVGIG